jgi:outer membrane lipoprotein-sorting protein
MNGDTTTVTLSNIKKNGVINTKIFDIDLRGATIIKA